jgi:hypothetical protein
MAFQLFDFLKTHLHNFYPGKILKEANDKNLYPLRANFRYLIRTMATCQPQFFLNFIYSNNPDTNPKASINFTILKTTLRNLIHKFISILFTNLTTKKSLLQQLLYLLTNLKIESNSALTSPAYTYIFLTTTNALIILSSLKTLICAPKLSNSHLILSPLIKTKNILLSNLTTNLTLTSYLTFHNHFSSTNLASLLSKTLRKTSMNGLKNFSQSINDNLPQLTSKNLQ